MIKYKPYHWLFILCGGQFYLDWILPTNPTSKNPFIKFIYSWNKDAYNGFNYKNRLTISYVRGIIHLLLFINCLYIQKFVSGSNVLVNIYPLIIQLYIGYRCWKIKTYKHDNRNLRSTR